MLEIQWSRGNFVCVGLDSEFSKIPKSVYRRVNGCDVSIANTITAFNRAIVEATHDIVCAYKLNTAFYEAQGVEGIEALHRSIADINIIASDVPVILDAKRGDVDNTNENYADAIFDFLRADAITVHPYLGAEALGPFLTRVKKGIFVLCRTSNNGAGEFQDLIINGHEPLYRFVARRVASEWNNNGNCALVVGATYPDELRKVREVAGDILILIPGIGAQGGSVSEVVTAGKDSRGQGIIINSSRGIIFSSNSTDFADIARHETIKLSNEINLYL